MLKGTILAKCWIILIGCVILITCANSNGYAQGDLMVFPKRIVFDGPRSTNELNLANIGNDTARYNISFVQYRMNEDGSFTAVSYTHLRAHETDSYLRYY